MAQPHHQDYPSAPPTVGIVGDRDPRLLVHTATEAASRTRPSRSPSSGFRRTRSRPTEATVTHISCAVRTTTTGEGRDALTLTHTHG